MAESDVTYSATTALAAARYFYWHRYLTKFGLMLLGSTVVLIVAIPIAHSYGVAGWILGAIGTLVVMNVLIHATTIAVTPRALSKSIAKLKSSVGHIETTVDGLKLSIDENVVHFPWSRIRYLWPRKDFIVLGLSPFSMLHIPTQGLGANVREEFEKRASKNFGA